MRQHRTVMSPERLPSMNLPRRVWLGQHCHRNRHSYPCFAAPAELPTRVHAHEVRTRPVSELGYSPFTQGPHEAHRLLQSNKSVSTPGTKPNSNTYAAANRHRFENTTREGSAHRDVTGQGPCAFRGRLWPPPRRPLALVDLPQPDLPEHPMSRIRASRTVETVHETPMR